MSFFRTFFRIVCAAGAVLSLLALVAYFADAKPEYIQIFENGEEDL